MQHQYYPAHIYHRKRGSQKRGDSENLLTNNPSTKLTGVEVLLLRMSKRTWWEGCDKLREERWTCRWQVNREPAKILNHGVCKMLLLCGVLLKLTDGRECPNRPHTWTRASPLATGLGNPGQQLCQWQTMEIINAGTHITYHDVPSRHYIT